MQSTLRREEMKNVFAAVVVVLGMTVGANAHEPCHPRVRLTSPECVVCHCNSFVVNRHYVGRGVWNYSKGVGGRAWNGLKTFATAAFKEPLIIPQRQYLVTPGYYSYHPGSVRRIRPVVPRVPQSSLGVPAPPED